MDDQLLKLGAEVARRQAEQDSYVFVRRHWNDWRTVKVHRNALERLHWTDESGGVGARSPRPFLHAYMWCAALGERCGDYDYFPHSCEHGPPPHNIKVCLVKKDNDPKVLQSLVDEEKEK